MGNLIERGEGSNFRRLFIFAANRRYHPGEKRLLAQAVRLA
jgi:hypothetical protein